MTSIYFDFETGGLRDDSPNIQLAAIAVDEATWEELGTFERKIQFDVATADPEALRMNHFDPDVWAREGVDPQSACIQFARFIDPFRSLMMTSKRTGRPYTVAKLIGHNAATFDGPRLQRMFKEHGLFLAADPRVRCTCQAAMFWFDSRCIQPPSYKLTDLCSWFGLPVADDAHDALADVRMTVALARRLRDARIPDAYMGVAV